MTSEEILQKYSVAMVTPTVFLCHDLDEHKLGETEEELIELGSSRSEEGGGYDPREVGVRLILEGTDTQLRGGITVLHV